MPNHAITARMTSVQWHPSVYKQDAKPNRGTNPPKSSSMAKKFPRCVNAGRGFHAPSCPSIKSVKQASVA